MLTGKNLIGYSLSGESEKKITVTLKTNNTEAYYFFHEASYSETDTAVLLADKAFKTYRHFTGEQKAAFFESIAEGIASAKDELVAVAMQETHLAKGRLEGEVQRTINQLKLFAQLLRDGSWVNAIIDTDGIFIQNFCVRCFAD